MAQTQCVSTTYKQIYLSIYSSGLVTRHIYRFWGLQVIKMLCKSAAVELCQKVLYCAFFVAMTGEAKRSHAFKVCERLKASNTMTGFGIRSPNSCISPQNGTRNDLRRSEILGSHAQTPLLGALCTLYYALPSIVIKRTLEPPFQNPRSATDLPIFGNMICYNTILLTCDSIVCMKWQALL